MRVSLHIDETCSADPVPVLCVNGAELRLDDREMLGLLNELLWCRETLQHLRRGHASSPAMRYVK